MLIRTLETEPSAGMAEERVREMGGGWKAATVGGGGRNGGCKFLLVSWVLLSSSVRSVCVRIPVYQPLASVSL